jgi:predicted extracellular nuclease
MLMKPQQLITISISVETLLCFDGATAFRISDHDPVVVGLNLNQSALGIQELQGKDE